MKKDNESQRQREALTQVVLAAAIGASVRTIKRIEAAEELPSQYRYILEVMQRRGKPW